jgi:hypothetical protein
MSKFKFDEVLDTQRRNQRFRQYDIDVVMVPFEHLRHLTATHRRVVAEAAVDAKLTAEGKTAAIQKSQATTREAITVWHEQRLRELDADLLSKRAAARHGRATGREARGPDGRAPAQTHTSRHRRLLQLRDRNGAPRN